MTRWKPAPLASTLSLALTLGLALASSACTDDGSAEADDTETDGTETETGGTETDGTETTESGESTEDESSESESDATDTDTDTDSTDSTDGGEDDVWAVVIQGTLFTDDLAEAQAFHDPLAAEGEEAAMMLGDFAHDPLTGADLLGTPTDSLLVIDRWTDLAGLQAFYADPMFAEAFGMLFADMPSVETYLHRPDWYGWGDMEAGDGADPYYFVLAQGHLADEPEAMQASHDAIAAGGEEAALMVGDVAHVVYLGVEDPRDFLAVDIWTESAMLEAFYMNPDFSEALGMLFDDVPTVAVYRSTDWHQW